MRIYENCRKNVVPDNDHSCLVCWPVNCAMVMHEDDLEAFFEVSKNQVFCFLVSFSFITSMDFHFLQSKGSAVWVAAPGRDISSMPTSSIYNLPPQGQHMTFTPTQAGHGTFPGVYHPAQAVTAAVVHPLLQQSQSVNEAVDMVGPGSSVYQQPQPGQLNWSSNY